MEKRQKGLSQSGRSESGSPVSGSQVVSGSLGIASSQLLRVDGSTLVASPPRKTAIAAESAVPPTEVSRFVRSFVRYVLFAGGKKGISRSVIRKEIVGKEYPKVSGLPHLVWDKGVALLRETFGYDLVVVDKDGNEEVRGEGGEGESRPARANTNFYLRNLYAKPALAGIVEEEGEASLGLLSVIVAYIHVSRVGYVSKEDLVGHLADIALPWDKPVPSISTQAPIAAVVKQLVAENYLTRKGAIDSDESKYYIGPRLYTLMVPPEGHDKAALLTSYIAKIRGDDSVPDIFAPPSDEGEGQGQDDGGEGGGEGEGEDDDGEGGEGRRSRRSRRSTRV